MKKLFLLLVCVFLSACAKHSPSLPTDVEAGKPWKEMTRLSNADQVPYRLQISMRFGDDGDTRRVTGLLWGNNQNILRLDVMAGVGATIAKIADAPTEFLAYLPRENRAYEHEGTNKPLLKVGVPVPFGLKELAALLNGHFTSVFGTQPESMQTLDGDEMLYKLGAPLEGSLTVDEQGQPLVWTQASGGWTLKFAYTEEHPGLPKSLRLNNLNGKKAIILVKERENPDAPFTHTQMSLELPKGTTILPLSEFKTGAKG